MAEKWAKMKVCNCVPEKYADIKISDSRSNPRRANYKCNLCGLFLWVNDEEIVFKSKGTGSAIVAGVKDGLSCCVKIAIVVLFVYFLYSMME
ncbi:unnamed protein product [Amaranthus hypochondriacus]